MKEKYDREVEEEEDEKAMGREYTTKLGPFVEVSNHTTLYFAIPTDQVWRLRTKHLYHGKPCAWPVEPI